MKNHKLLLIGGSFNDRSYSSNLLKTIEQTWCSELDFIKAMKISLPVFSNELTESELKNLRNLEQSINESDGVIIATPVHNDTISCYIKNIIDHTSIPRGSNFWYKKPVAVINFVEQMHGSDHALKEMVHLLKYVGADVAENNLISFCRALNVIDIPGTVISLSDKKKIKDLLNVLIDKINCYKGSKKLGNYDFFSLWNNWG